MPRDFAVPTLGYVLVAAFCYLAGRSLSGQPVAHLTTALEATTIATIFVPFLVNHAVLYDSEARWSAYPDLRTWTKRWSVEQPVTMTVLPAPLLACCFALMWNDQMWTVAGRLAAATLPYALYVAWRILRWPHSDIFMFRHRTFVPALFTCILPFTFGFSAGADPWITSTMAVLPLAAWLLFGTLPLWFAATIGGTIVLVLCATLFAASPAQPWLRTAQAAAIGLLMVLTMGVCESLKVSWRVANDAEQLVQSPRGVDPKVFYEGGTFLAAMVLSLTFQLSYLYPTASRVWFLGSIAIGVTLFSLGVLNVGYRAPNFARQAAATAIGLAIPALILIEAIAARPATPFAIAIPAVGVGALGSLASFAGTFRKWVGESLRALRVDFWTATAHMPVRLTMSALFSLSLAFLLALVGMVVADDAVVDRLSAIVVVYMVTAIACSLSLKFAHGLPPRVNDGPRS